MELKIYFNDKALLLTDKPVEKLHVNNQTNGTYLLNELSEKGIEDLLKNLKKDEYSNAVFYHSDGLKLKDFFFRRYSLIQAAGGLVHDEERNLLFIYRRGKWDLPKGKLDPGESAETCAERELKEETGLQEAELEKHLITTYHTYSEEGNNLLKETFWYQFNAPAGQKLQPQMEEQIAKAEWVNPSNISHYLNNTYELIKDVLKAGEVL